MKPLFDSQKPIIGMVNLKPLPGSRGFTSMGEILAGALTDVQALLEGGVDAILVENTLSYPRDPVIGPETVASMAIAVHEIVKASSLPVGVVTLMEPGDNASLAIALAAGASFIRAISFNEATVTSFGILEGRPAKLHRFRALLGLEALTVLADVHVKHSTPLTKRSIEEAAIDAVKGGADAIIVTGTSTGRAPTLQMVREVKRVIATTPVVIGSGADPENIGGLLDVADGVVVGSSLKKDGVYTNRVDAERVAALVSAARSATRPGR